MIYCTSVNCPYADQCSRKDNNKPESREDTYYDFQLGGCDTVNNFPDYIKCKGDDQING